MTASDTMGVVVRVKECLARQSAAFDRALSEFGRVPESLPVSGGESLRPWQPALEQDFAGLEAELGALLHEWESALGITAADRTEVAALARHAEEQAEQLRAAYGRMTAKLDERADEVQRALAGLRKGRHMLAKYRPGPEEEARFVDRSG